MVMDCGSVFDKFDQVFSGHFHTRIYSNGNIHYLGNPYEMFWNDVNDPEDLHSLIQILVEHTPGNNPYKLFHNVYYEDTPSSVV